MDRTVYSQRLGQVRQKMSDIGADGLYISSSQNRRWLSGFTGSSGWLIVTAERALLGTDFRYWEQAQTQAPCFELFRLNKDRTQNDLIRAAEVQDIALEAQHVSVKEYGNLEELEEINWILSEGLLEELRMCKDASELALIKRAAQITDQAMAKVAELARIGMTERELAWELEKYMREHGASAMTFPVIVASGPNSALPHYAPADRRIQPGDILLIDMGASHSGYGSDLTRTFLVGADEDPVYRQRFDLVLHAHDMAIAAITPGVTGYEVDAVARDKLGEAGYGEHFGHGLGHGLGLEGHEGPRLATTRGDTKLAPGMVATVEPGLYIPGWGGIRIEDLVVVTEQSAERLSHCPIKPYLELS